MFTAHTDEGFTTVLPGIARKTLVYGETTMLVKFQLQKGFPLPRHAHPHEQTGYLVNGRLRLTIDQEVRELQPGDSWCIKGGVEHSAEVLEDCVAIEIFSPLREDYL